MCGTLHRMDDRFYDLRLRDFLLFDRVATRGTISAAARELGIPKPTASRRLQVMEQHLGQVLLQRNTRQASLTDRGQAFLTAVRSLLLSAEAARLAGTGDEPSGTLRISVPIPLGRLVGGRVIAAFRRRLPGVRLEITLENQ
ncbi:MAG: molybdate transport repressor ModE-like protein, partial [Myxococcota bacterium]